MSSDAPESPCVGICTLDEAEVCLGCQRTLDEIAGWEDLEAAQQRAILAELPARRGTAS